MGQYKNIRNRMKRWMKLVLIVLVVIVSASAGYYWCYQITLSQLPIMLNKVQANSAFNRIVQDSYIVDLMKRNCAEDALKMLEWNLETQKWLLADFVEKGVGSDFVKYVEDRVPGLIDSQKVGQISLQRNFEVQCPPQQHSKPESSKPK
jgi:hypothetical protein